MLFSTLSDFCTRGRHVHCMASQSHAAENIDPRCQSNARQGSHEHLLRFKMAATREGLGGMGGGGGG
jgi:hypothetical protein